MRLVSRGAVGLGLLLAGYVLGSTGVLSPTWAQQPPELLPETVEKVKAAYNALSLAGSTLQQEKAYVPAMKGVNAFAILAGGLDAKQDLESGRGVDPETFAALYAGLASDDIKKDIDRDEQNRVTYKGKVVQMYPIVRLKQLFEARAKLTGEAG
jgi:hypothetical protein